MREAGSLPYRKTARRVRAEKGMNNMSEEAKKAIEELVKVTEKNDLAKAFLRGFKSGMETAGGTQEEEKTDAN